MRVFAGVLVLKIFVENVLIDSHCWVSLAHTTDVVDLAINVRKGSQFRNIIQEAQLPLRNRASAMHFFVAKLLSIAVMTYSTSITSETYVPQICKFVTHTANKL